MFRVRDERVRSNARVGMNCMKRVRNIFPVIILGLTQMPALGDCTAVFDFRVGSLRTTPGRVICPPVINTTNKTMLLSGIKQDNISITVDRERLAPGESASFIVAIDQPAALKNDLEASFKLTTPPYEIAIRVDIAEGQAGEASTAATEALLAKILSLPDEPDRPVYEAIQKLGEYGAAAKPAVRKLAGRLDLGVPKKTWAGTLLADYEAFNPIALKTLLKHPNAFVQMEAVVHLADLGGDENRRAILTAGRENPALQATSMFTDALSAMPATPRLPDSTMKSLDAMLNSPSEQTVAVSSANVRLAYDEHPFAVNWALRKLARLRVTGDRAAFHSGRALADFNASDLTALNGFVARSNNKWLRYYAVKALSKSGRPGKVLLQNLLSEPGEPLKPLIEKALRNDLDEGGSGSSEPFERSVPVVRR